MGRSFSRLWVTAVVAVMSATGAACSDVGDNTGIPGSGGQDSSVDVTVDTGTGGDDGTTSSSSSGGGSSGGGASSGGGEGGSTEAAAGDAGQQPDTGEQDSYVAPDVGGPDSTIPDAGSPDTSVADNYVADSSAADTYVADNYVADTYVADTYVADNYVADTSVPDAGHDAPPADTGTPDAGQDTGGSQGDGGLVPCTTVGQTGCVKCFGNNKTTGALANGTCTATEALFVQHDIDKGFVTAPGNDENVAAQTSMDPTMMTCYQCLFDSTCIDDTQYSDTGHECTDTAITVGTAAECEAVISCVLGASCSSTAISTCYCGTAGLTTTCQGNPNSANGACASQIATAVGFSTLDGTDNLTHFTDNNRAGGIANQIFNCAVGSMCTKCLQ